MKDLSLRELPKRFETWGPRLYNHCFSVKAHYKDLRMCRRNSDVENKLVLMVAMATWCNCDGPDNLITETEIVWWEEKGPLSGCLYSAKGMGVSGRWGEGIWTFLQSERTETGNPRPWPPPSCQRAALENVSFMRLLRSFYPQRLWCCAPGCH